MNYIEKDIKTKVGAALGSSDYESMIHYLDGLIIELSEL